MLVLVILEIIAEWPIIKIIILCRVRESSPFLKNFAAQRFVCWVICYDILIIMSSSRKNTTQLWLFHLSPTLNPLCTHHQPHQDGGGQKKQILAIPPKLGFYDSSFLHIRVNPNLSLSFCINMTPEHSLTIHGQSYIPLLIQFDYASGAVPQSPSLPQSPLNNLSSSTIRRFRRLLLAENTEAPASGSVVYCWGQGSLWLIRNHFSNNISVFEKNLTFTCIM